MEDDDSDAPSELEKSLDGNHGSIPENAWFEWQNRIRILPSMLWDFRGIIRYEHFIWKDNNCRILSKSIDEFIRAVEAETAVYRTRNEMRNFAARRCLALPKTRDDLCVGMESAATCGILSRLGWPVGLSSFSKSSWHHLSEEDIRKCIDDLVTNEQPSFFGDGTYLRI